MVAVATASALLAIALGWRGSDLPAQVFRAELFRQDGFVLWNSQWFGGHAVLGYSVIAPAISAADRTARARCAERHRVGAVMFERILRFSFGPRRVARQPLVRARHRHQSHRRAHDVRVRRRARARRDLRAAASPRGHRGRVRGAVLAREPARRLLPRDRRGRVGGRATRATRAGARARVRGARPDRDDRVALPDRRSGAVRTVGADLGPLPAARSSPPRCGATPAARWGAALLRAVAIGSYVVPTALGGNVSRLGQYVAGPLLACALLPRRRLLLAALAIPLLIWQWFPAVDGIAFAHTDPSTRASYYTPLLTYLGTPGRTRSAGSRSRRPTGTGKRRTRRRTCCSRAVGNASSTSRTTRSSTRSRSPPATYRIVAARQRREVRRAPGRAASTTRRSASAR